MFSACQVLFFPSHTSTRMFVRTYSISHAYHHQNVCTYLQYLPCISPPECLYVLTVSPMPITCSPKLFLLNLITTNFYCRYYEAVQGSTSPGMMPSCWASSSPCFNASKCLGALENTNPTKKCDIPEDTLFSSTAVRRSTHV